MTIEEKVEKLAYLVACLADDIYSIAGDIEVRNSIAMVQDDAKAMAAGA
jgi:hypothetical protein